VGNQSENSAGRGQILKVNSCSIDKESDEICTVQTDLQQIYSKSDSLLGEKAGAQGGIMSFFTQVQPSISASKTIT
jgi:hypothetical protein